MSDFIAWCCEYENNTGETILAKKFIKKKLNNQNVIILKPKLNYLFFKYLNPLLGILVLWYYHIIGKRTIYVNYLPLWNFLIFLLLPSKTVLGPITGSIQINKINGIKSFIRKYLFPICYRFSLLILDVKKKKIIFATNILKYYISKKFKNKIIFNFLLQGLKIKKNFIKKKYDIIFYYRKHENKFFEHHINYLKNQISKKKKIVIIGEDLYLKGALHLGKLNNNNVKKTILLSKCVLSGDDNVLSIFNLKCLKNNLKIIYNDKLTFQIPNLYKSKFIPINYD